MKCKLTYKEIKPFMSLGKMPLANGFLEENEFKTEFLGSQDTLIGGGRYDGLIKTLGGQDIPGVGWAGGIERIMLLMKELI